MINLNEWIYYYFIKDEEALPVIIEFFRPVVKSVIQNKFSSQFALYCTQEDYFQMFDQLLVQSLESYRLDSKMGFCNYYCSVVRNRCVDIIRMISRTSSYNLAYTVSLDMAINETHHTTYGEIISDSDDCSLHDYVVGSITCEQIFEKAQNELKPLDYEILKAKWQGDNCQEIAKQVHLSRQGVQYRIKKIRKWLLKIDKV